MRRSAFGKDIGQKISICIHLKVYRCAEKPQKTVNLFYVFASTDQGFSTYMMNIWPLMVTMRPNCSWA